MSSPGTDTIGATRLSEVRGDLEIRYVGGCALIYHSTVLLITKRRLANGTVEQSGQLPVAAVRDLEEQDAVALLGIRWPQNDENGGEVHSTVSALRREGQMDDAAAMWRRRNERELPWPPQFAT